MRHLNSGRKLNRTSSHRKAMLSNLATSILDEERVTTTVTKAKEVRSVVERLITYGKKGDLGAIRQAARTVRDKDVLKKLFDDIAPTYKEREGGYTRVMKLGNRKGDNAEMAIIELVGREGDEPRKRGGGKKKAARKSAPKAAPKATEEPKEAPQAEAVAEETAAPQAAETPVSEESETKATSEESGSEAAEEK